MTWGFSQDVYWIADTYIFHFRIYSSGQNETIRAVQLACLQLSDKKIVVKFKSTMQIDATAYSSAVLLLTFSQIS